MPIDRAKRLEQLEKILLDLPNEAMLGSQLDGYLAGILVCPALIPPSEWLPAVWGAAEGEDEPVFDTEQQARHAIRLVMDHYNSIAAALMAGRGRYEAIFETDTRHDETLWEIWAEGFARAMGLRPSSWASLATADPDTRAALASLRDLIDIADQTSRLTKQEVHQLTTLAPDLIPDWVEALHAHRTGAPRHPTLTPATATTRKPGRNNPCTCGSGKKHKKCCGAV